MSLMTSQVSKQFNVMLRTLSRLTSCSGQTVRNEQSKSECRCIEETKATEKRKRKKDKGKQHKSLQIYAFSHTA